MPDARMSEGELEVLFNTGLTHACDAAKLAIDDGDHEIMIIMMTCALQSAPIELVMGA